MTTEQRRNDFLTYFNSLSGDYKGYYKRTKGIFAGETEINTEATRLFHVSSFFEITDIDKIITLHKWARDHSNPIYNKYGRGTPAAVLSLYRKYLKSSTASSSSMATPIPPTLPDNPASPINLILYGPPGTGKTFNTIFKALDLLGIPVVNKGKSANATWFNNEDANRDVALEKFNEMKNLGRIVFTTFHQSMSYEDFVEGIKPVLDGKTVGYEVKDGLFKQISDEAAKEKNRDNKFVLIIDEINRGNIANIFGELITLIEEDKRTTKFDKSVGKYVDNPEGIRVKLPFVHSKKVFEEKTEKDDDIETLTISADESSDAIVGAEDFGVPGNLFIIGTMNTADRSVEALDSALRRRFSFEEMMPKPKLLKTVLITKIDKTLETLLTTINERIELLKDREHQIGHSYFMKYADRAEIEPEELLTVFTDRIIPLLQEYFYGDYEKIRLVVGDGFVKEESDKVYFAGKKPYDDIPEKRYSIVKKPEMEVALKKLLNLE